MPGREFGWLRAAYSGRTVGTWLALDASPLIAVRVLHSSPAQVSALSAAGLASDPPIGPVQRPGDPVAPKSPGVTRPVS